MKTCRSVNGSLLLLICLTWQAVRADEPETILPERCLVLSSNVRRGRDTLRQCDAIEAMFVRGELVDYQPRAGDTLEIGGEQPAAWKTAEFDAGGELSRESIGRGGYVYVPIESNSERVMMLNAAGHGALYFNGRPHTANIYGYDYFHIPVHLKKGVNHLLIRSGRGNIQAKLYAPPAKVFLLQGDMTLPDLIVGQPTDAWGAVIVVNTSDQTQRGLTLISDGALLNTTHTFLPAIAPMSIHKAGFRLSGPSVTEQNDVSMCALELMGSEQDLHQQNIELRVRQPFDAQKRTFVSQLDNSVQYFGLRPAVPASDDDPPPALVLSCHGASVEAIGQASSYSPKSWLHLVAPTNRRPYGFDWEDLGRADAMEVLALAKSQLPHDASRTYLTGHSMGGHGTWHLGSLFPDTFAAIGPSAGWISYTSYARQRREPEAAASAMDELLQRGRLIGDPRELLVNLKQQGIYVLHGGDDRSVPASQAQTMAAALEPMHNDWAFHEEPDKGHWWSNELDDGGATCMDWPEMYDMFGRHALPLSQSVRTIEFATANPGVSSSCHWLSIEGQLRHHAVSRVKIHTLPNKRRFFGTTENVAILKLDVNHLLGSGPLSVELDGQQLADISYPERHELWLARRDQNWSVIDPPPLSHKGSHRYGSIKNELRNRFLFVYGTAGDDDENNSLLNKVRLDAETLWYRGNGGVEIVADVEFDPEAYADRNVILYGNADTNAAWPKLLSDSPVQVFRDRIQLGERMIPGSGLATMFVRPRPDSDIASVVVMSATGVAGMRLSCQQSLFVPFVRFPDCTVLSDQALEQGRVTVEAAGYFGLDWSLDSGEFVWRDPSL